MASSFNTRETCLILESLERRELILRKEATKTRRQMGDAKDPYAVELDRLANEHRALREKLTKDS